MAVLDDSLEDLMSVTEAAQTLPGRPHPGTLIRWGKGIRGIKLPFKRIGGRLFVSRAALLEFIDALTAASDDSSNYLPTVGNRRSKVERAERELATHFDLASGKSRESRKTPRAI